MKTTPIPLLSDMNSGHAERDELIERYFKTGLGYDEILLLLGLLHGIALRKRLTELSYRNAFFLRFKCRSDSVRALIGQNPCFIKV